MNLTLIDAVEFTDYESAVCRLVETQEDAATLSLVDNLEEQALLESVLDAFKPPYRDGTKHRHYLIATPFRYPPLQHGSRWGGRHQRSFFYASEDEPTCLAEAAFYRLAFCEGKSTPFSEPLQSDHSLFYVDVKSSKTANMCQMDESVQVHLTNPVSYSMTQKIGAKLRNRNVEVIRYRSARWQEGINVAIDQPASITSDEPYNATPMTCETDTATGIVRFAKKRQFPVSFQRVQLPLNELFLV